MARRTSPPSGAVVLTDPSAVRALAHPARLVVIDALYAGQVLTATECAELAGTPPSAMSYHLRALEKYGLVVRAEPRGDARERPWMRAGDSLTVSMAGSGSSRLAAAELLVENSMQTDLRRLLSTMRADAEAGPEGEWSGTTTYSRDQLLMTAEEARELRDAVDRLVAQFSWDKRQARKPRGATTFTSSFILAREAEPG